MSATTVDNTKLTVQQRSQQSAEEIAAQLGIENVKLVSAAVLEAALQEMHQNQDFEQRVKSVCDRLQASQSKPRKTPPPKKASLHNTNLIPIHFAQTHHFDLAAPPDPFFLLDLYGADQLVAALDEYSTPFLKKSVTVIKERFPGKKPKPKATREDIINFLAEVALANK